MKRYTLSFIVLVFAIGIPFLLINPSGKDAISGDARVTRMMLSEALTTAISIAEKNYYKPIEDPNDMFRGSIKGALASLMIHTPITSNGATTNALSKIFTMPNSEDSVYISTVIIAALLRSLNRFQTHPLRSPISKRATTSPKSTVNGFISAKKRE